MRMRSRQICIGLRTSGVGIHSKQRLHAHKHVLDHCATAVYQLMMCFDTKSAALRVNLYSK